METQPTPRVLLRRATHWERRSYWFLEVVVEFEVVGRKECHGKKLDAATKDRARQTTWRMSENVSLAFGQ